jgi:hypothetical protein
MSPLPNSDELVVDDARNRESELVPFALKAEFAVVEIGNLAA